MAFAVSEQKQAASEFYFNPFLQISFFKLSAEQSTWTYILILRSIQYIHIQSI